MHMQKCILHAYIDCSWWEEVRSAVAYWFWAWYIIAPVSRLCRDYERSRGWALVPRGRCSSSAAYWQEQTARRRRWTCWRLVYSDPHSGQSATCALLSSTSGHYQTDFTDFRFFGFRSLGFSGRPTSVIGGHSCFTERAFLPTTLQSPKTVNRRPVKIISVAGWIIDLAGWHEKTNAIILLTYLSFNFTGEAAVASLRFVSPGEVTDNDTFFLLFYLKKWWPFLVVALKSTDFLGHLLPSPPFQVIVCPVLL